MSLIDIFPVSILPLVINSQNGGKNADNANSWRFSDDYFITGYDSKAYDEQ